MWRAWGIACLVLSQDLGPAVTETDHEFSVRPPSGWVGKPGMRPTVLRLLHPVADNKADAEIQLTHLVTTNPTPLKSFEAQAKTHVQERFKGAVVHEEKTFTLDGRPAFRIAFTHDNALFIKTAVHRTHLEYYLLDILLPQSDVGKQRAVAEASVASFRIVPSPLSPEEAEAFAKGREALKASKIDPAQLGERWYLLQLGGRKSGHQRLKLAAAPGGFAFESDVVLDLGDGNRDASTLRGSFSPDGLSQRLESEQIKTNDKKERWEFRATAELREGKLKVSRDMNGHKEEKTLDVPEGVVLADIMEFQRGRLALQAKGALLVKTISPFSDEPNIEMIEAAGAEEMDVDGRRLKAVVALTRFDRRKTIAYTYGTDGALLRQGGPKDVFSVRASTKDEALKP